MTVSQSNIDAAIHLLNTSTLSQKAISKRLNVSRRLVNDLATGKRLRFLDTSREKDEVNRFYAGKPERCEGCGALAHLSKEYGLCFACEIRVKQKPSIYITGDEKDCKLKFDDKEQISRYEKLRLIKEREALQPIL